MIAIAGARGTATVVALAAGLLLLVVLLLRARRSRHPELLYTCAGYMALLHGVWIWGLWGAPLFGSAFATLMLLTFPWSGSVTSHMSMAGFGTLPDILLNYARFVLGFGGMQCLVLTLFVWELKFAPRRRSRSGRV